VDADVEELRKTEVTLTNAGFVVAAVDSFPEARALLHSIAPEIVVADVRLKAYNGLQLAVLFAATRPRTPFIVTHTVHDPVLEADAKRFGAVYVIKTPDRAELRGLAKSLFDQSGGAERVRRWTRKAAPVATPVRVGDADAALVDVSYSGLRIKVDARPARVGETRDKGTVDVEFPDIELSLRASSIWTARDMAAEEGWLWGIDVSMNDLPKIERWRAFVDSVL